MSNICEHCKDKNKEGNYIFYGWEVCIDCKTILDIQEIKKFKRWKDENINS